MTQEFQLLSNDNSSAISWLVGLYYSHIKAADAPFPIFFQGNALFPIDVHSEQRVESYAAFGEAHVKLTSATGMTLGVRYSQDSLDLSGNTYFGSAHTSLAGPYKRHKKFDEPTWRLGIDHKFTDDVLAHRIYSRGYKMGFYDLLVTSGVPKPPVNSEKPDAVEVGVKSDWLNRRLRVNASSFYYKYKDMQAERVNDFEPQGDESLTSQR